MDRIGTALSSPPPPREISAEEFVQEMQEEVQHLQHSLHQHPLRDRQGQAERLAAEGTGLNQFVATIVAEKVAALRSASLFTGRKGRADWTTFDRLMARPGGEPPPEQP